MKRKAIIVVCVLGLGVLIAIAYQRSGLLNLPDVPKGISIRQAGLQELDQYADMAQTLEGGNISAATGALATAAGGVAAIKAGSAEEGLGLLQKALQEDPRNLVIGNALRMHTMKLKHQWIRDNARRKQIDIGFPAYLEEQPIAFLRELATRQPLREVKFQLAMALVDQMILFPALEIKAPSSVESVAILTEILESADKEGQYYIPALYARGLNYLYRPYNLVWPEKIAASPSAASDDLARCVAIGEQVGGASPRLKAELSLALGDAYAKEGRFNQARSWWQIAKGMVGDADIREGVLTRLTWEDDNVRPRLAKLLDTKMNNIEEPLSDMRFLWK